MHGHTSKVVELVGSSRERLDGAINNAIERAGKSLQNLGWFEIREVRGNIGDGKRGWYQVKMGAGLRVLEPEDLSQE